MSNEGDASPVRRPQRRSRRRWLIAAALVGVCGAAALVAALVYESGAAIAAAETPTVSASPQTPLVSARRVPRWTTALIADRALVAAVDPIVAGAAPNTCVAVGNGVSSIYSHNASAALVPASNQKLLTTAAALDILGADRTLSTEVVADSPVSGGVVSGNLYLVGGGDPLLTTEGYQLSRGESRLPETDLEAMADELVADGLRQVTGSVVGDASRYDDQHSVPGWAERWLSNRTVAPLSALLVNDAWLIDPTTGEGPGGTATAPAAHAAAVFTQLLVERGVVVAGPAASGTAPAGAEQLLSTPSLPMSGLVDEVLSFSDNTSAELLLKEIGVEVSGEGSTAAGAAAVSDWAAAQGFTVEGAVITDGSGLSSSNRVSCDLLADVLRSGGPDGAQADGLAIPGQPGTLSDRFGGEEWPMRLRAKTGTLNDVTALSGWLVTRPGSTLDFEIVTNTEGRAVSADDIAFESRLLTALLDQPMAPPVAEAGPLPPGQA